MEEARIAGIGAAFPPTVLVQREVLGMLPEGHARREVLRRILAGSGILRRRMVIDPRHEDVSAWTTAERMRRFQRDALPLAATAVSTALARAAVDPGDIGMLCVVSSTGYGTPGVDSRLIRDLGMRPDTQRLAVGHMGCFGALPGLAACTDFVRGHARPAVLLNVELSSLHLQPAPWDMEQFVVNSLFGDAAVAMVVRADDRAEGVGPALRVLDTASYTDHGHEDHMTWEVGDTGFLMGLSSKVPDLIAARLPEVVGGLLGPRGLTVGDVRWWAVHPGGPRIIDAAEQGLGLAPELTADSRRVLAEYGNCSSAGLPIVLAELLHTGAPVAGTHGVAMTFGPGLTLYTALLLGE
ncbi:type III polyketide synthase [Nocardiopsis mangrovi]|uniref:Type III polyketide synthase n=1 Tax=Nocardiopsis mangrovi TaxID=1179818 RepID=A0ABV9E0W6_9ACTN